MADDDRSQPPSGGGFPPTPPVDEPQTDPSRGSLVRGAVLGFAATVVAPVALLTYAGGSEWWSLTIWLIPIVLLAGISLAIRGSTRRTGIGLLLGFAVAVVVLAGAYFVLFNIDEG